MASGLVSQTVGRGWLGSVAQALLGPILPSHLGPTGLVSCRGLFAIMMGHHPVVRGQEGGQVYLISCHNVGAFSAQCK